MIRLKEFLFPPQSLVSMRLVLLLSSIECWTKSFATTVAKRDTMQRIILSPKEILQRISNSLDNHAINHGKWKVYLGYYLLYSILGWIPKRLRRRIITIGITVSMASTVTITSILMMVITSLLLQNKLEKTFFHFWQCKHTVCREGTPMEEFAWL